MLQPNEEIKIMSVSGGCPKKECSVNLVCLPLGQNTFDDIIQLETQDHAALVMNVSYCAHFKLDDNIKKNPDKLFNVSDFIGIACKTVASRIRGAVSQIQYNEFHHNYSSIVKSAVFGDLSECFFPDNNFCLTECDVKSLEPFEANIREKLKQNTSQAIDFKTKASELEFKMKSKILEEESEGQLEIQRLVDWTKAAEAQVGLDKLTAESDAIQQVGEQVAIAKAQAEGEKIRGDSLLKQSEFSASSHNVESEALIRNKEMVNRKVEHQTKQKNDLEAEKLTKMAEIEVTKFKDTVESIGRETIIAMARSGPENKAKLLKSLGLEGYLVTDGKTPINLFGAADGLIKPA